MNKIALGTVQFGMDYGINNQRGKIPETDVFEILTTAYQHGIRVIDTAYDYGTSEKVIGKFIKKNAINFKVVSKLPLANLDKIEQLINQSLERLNINSFYGYLIHNFSSFLKTSEVYDLLKILKKNGVIEKLGFSLYYPHELENLLNDNINFDLIQVPYNVFDQRFSPYFKNLKKRGIEIHTRSAFLQGLVFKKPDSLEKKFLKIKNKLQLLVDISKKSKMPISALCINFAIINPYIDKIIIGVDSLLNLQENINDLKYKKLIKSVYNELESLNESDEKIILPINWH